MPSKAKVGVQELQSWMEELAGLKWLFQNVDTVFFSSKFSVS